MIGMLSSRGLVENVTSIESVPRSAASPLKPIDVASELPGGPDGRGWGGGGFGMWQLQYVSGSKRYVPLLTHRLVSQLTNSCGKSLMPEMFID